MLSFDLIAIAPEKIHDEGIASLFAFTDNGILLVSITAIIGCPIAAYGKRIEPEIELYTGFFAALMRLLLTHCTRETIHEMLTLSECFSEQDALMMRGPPQQSSSYSITLEKNSISE